MRRQTNYEIKMYLSATEVETQEEAKSSGWRDLIKKMEALANRQQCLQSLLELTELCADSIADKHKPRAELKGNNHHFHVNCHHHDDNCNSSRLNYLCAIYSGGTANYTPARLLNSEQEKYLQQFCQ